MDNAIEAQRVLSEENTWSDHCSNRMNGWSNKDIKNPQENGKIFQ